MARNRVIYQSQALFIAPSSTGYHMQTGNSSSNRSIDTVGNTNWTGVTGITFPDGAVTLGSVSITQPMFRGRSTKDFLTILYLVGLPLRGALPLCKQASWLTIPPLCGTETNFLKSLGGFVPKKNAVR